MRELVLITYFKIFNSIKFSQTEKILIFLLLIYKIIYYTLQITRYEIVNDVNVSPFDYRTDFPLISACLHNKHGNLNFTTSENEKLSSYILKSIHCSLLIFKSNAQIIMKIVVNSQTSLWKVY